MVPPPLPAPPHLFLPQSHIEGPQWILMLRGALTYVPYNMSTDDISALGNIISFLQEVRASYDITSTVPPPPPSSS